MISKNFLGAILIYINIKIRITFNKNFVLGFRLSSLCILHYIQNDKIIGSKL